LLFPLGRRLSISCVLASAQPNHTTLQLLPRAVPHSQQATLAGSSMPLWAYMALELVSTQYRECTETRGTIFRKSLEAATAKIPGSWPTLIDRELSPRVLHNDVGLPQTHALAGFSFPREPNQLFVNKIPVIAYNVVAWSNFPRFAWLDYPYNPPFNVRPLLAKVASM